MADPRRYHHGNLRAAVLEAAVEDIAAHGPMAMSLRRIARRAGVSHTAPTHHFGDKVGVLTAVATEGYALLADATDEALRRHGALVEVGLAYVRFALGRRPHFEVMFRPELYRSCDPALVEARDAAREVLFRAVRHALPDAADAEVWGGVVAAWSFTHGLATLWLNANFAEELGDDVDAVARLGVQGIEALVRRGAL